MKQDRQQLVKPHLLGIVLLTAIGCSEGQSGGQPQTEKPAAPSLSEPKEAVSSATLPAFRYRLVADGLPVEGRWKSTPVFADVNQDGFLDLATHPRLAEGARVWLGNGKGTWTDASQGLAMDTSCGGGIRFGDINKDGRLDVAVADHCQGVFVYLGDGQGHWRVTTEKLNSELARKMASEDPEGNTFSGAEDLAVGDVNEDGFLDIVASGSDQGGFTVYLGNGTGKNWKEAKADGLPSGEDPEAGDEEAGGWANKLLLHDMNGDGHLDVVSSYYLGPRVWWGDGKGHWQSQSKGLARTILGGLYRGIAVADLNRDGRVDLAVANAVNGAEAFLQNADGSWQGPIDMMPVMKGGAQAIALGDLNKDGHTDVVVGGQLLRSPDSQYGVFIRCGDGKGGWTEAQETSLPTTGLEVTWGITLADVNGDNRLDMAVSTGGAMGRKRAEFGESPQKVAGGKDKETLPRMQVWINEGTSRG